MEQINAVGVRILTGNASRAGTSSSGSSSTNLSVSYESITMKLPSDGLIMKGKKVELNMKLQDYENFLLTPIRNCEEYATIALTDWAAYQVP